MSKKPPSNPGQFHHEFEVGPLGIDETLVLPLPPGHDMVRVILRSAVNVEEVRLRRESDGDAIFSIGQDVQTWLKGHELPLFQVERQDTVFVQGGGEWTTYNPDSILGSRYSDWGTFQGEAALRIVANNIIGVLSSGPGESLIVNPSGRLMVDFIPRERNER